PYSRQRSRTQPASTRSRGEPATCGSAVRKAWASRSLSGDGRARKRRSIDRSRTAERAVKPYMLDAGFCPKTRRTQRKQRTQRIKPFFNFSPTCPTCPNRLPDQATCPTYLALPALPALPPLPDLPDLPHPPHPTPTHLTLP